MLIVHRAMSVLPDVSEVYIYSKAGLDFMVFDIGYVPEIQAYSDIGYVPEMQAYSDIGCP
jgi:hypothetical protein